MMNELDAADRKDVIQDQSEQSGMKRRSFVVGGGVLLVGGLGVSYLKRRSLLSLFGNLVSKAQANRKSPETTNSSIPSAADVRAYREFLNAHPMKYLSSGEILRPHFKKRQGVQSGIPPSGLWQNIVPTLRVANEIRQRLNTPLRYIVSAYRSPAYNAKCPGASKYSLHMQNRALDLVFDCSPRQAFDMANQLRKAGYFKGGIGLYKTFIHIDTRGRNATWGI
ncbi:MAG: YcbK family protein [Akkermansiaceae bacterium]